MDNNPLVISLSKLMNENHLMTRPDQPIKTNILVIVDKNLFNENLEKITGFFSNKVTLKFTHVENIDMENKKSLYDAILSGVIGDYVPCNLDLFSAYTELLISGGTLIVKTEHNTEEKLYKSLKMCGFLNVAANKTSGIVIGNTPTYKIGSSDKVILNSETKGNVISAWKLDDYNSETISEDDLLEAGDLKKPVTSSLRVCATTKKAKACKDCSCGLAEELEAASKLVAPKPDTSNAKSSCGSCYLGDAFRCASCPYLGMPAFKPGEKVQLAGNLLQDDF